MAQTRGSNRKVLVLAGDGIGPEIMRQAWRVIEFFDRHHIASFDVSEGLVGGAAYDDAGVPLTDETLDHARASDAVLFGAVGGAKWDELPFELRPERGILPVALPKEIVEELMEDAKKGANAVMTVDLESQTISRPDGEKVHFELDAFRKHCLLNGLDDIGLTEQKTADIGAYEAKARLARPWQFGMTQRGA